MRPATGFPPRGTPGTASKATMIPRRLRTRSARARSGGREGTAAYRAGSGPAGRAFSGSGERAA